jgi:hypothetical protein
LWAGLGSAQRLAAHRGRRRKIPPLKHAFAWCLTLLALAGLPFVAETEGMEAYLDRGGELRDRLVLEDAQSGFAGVTADIWAIEPDGAFSVARRLDGGPIAPTRTGALAPDELERLAEVLATQNFYGLPAEFGTPAKVNARKATMSFGAQVSVFWLTPGQDLASFACASDRTSAVRRFAAIAEAILGTLGPLETKADPSTSTDEPIEDCPGP